jgi:hypothetical protein
MKQALEMSIDEYTVNVYEGLVAQARATPSIFFACDSTAIYFNYFQRFGNVSV